MLQRKKWERNGKQADEEQKQNLNKNGRNLRQEEIWALLRGKAKEEICWKNKRKMRIQGMKRSKNRK